MSGRVLVLDRDYRPHRIVSWQRAVSMWWQDKVEILEEYEEEVRSVTLTIKMPAVVRLLRAISPRKRGIKFSRINVMTRDNFACQYCSAKLPMSKLNYDHVTPRSQGGQTTWENIVTACYPCNDKKRNMTPEQAGMRLRKVPVKPTTLPVIAMRIEFQKDFPACWKSWLYWNAELEP